MIKRIWVVYFCSFMITIFMLATLTFDLFKIRELNEIQGKDSKLSFFWFLTQAEREARAFYQDYSLYYSGFYDISQEDVLTSFDIYWSRHDPEMNENIQKIAFTIDTGMEFLEFSRNALLKIDAILKREVLATDRDLAEVIQISEDYFEKLNVLSVNALHVRLDTRQQRLSTLNDLYVDLSITLFSLLLSALLAISFFIKRGKLLESQNLAFERKVVERTIALKESERRFKSFALIGADWYWEMDENFAFTYLADGIERVSGLQANYFVNHSKENHYGLKGRLNILSLEKYKEKIVNRERFHDLETIWKREDGAIVAISVSAEPRFDDDGKFLGYVGAGRDVSEKYFVEALDKRLIAAINSLNLMVSIYDENDNLVFFNRQYHDFIHKMGKEVVLGSTYEEQWKFAVNYFTENYGGNPRYWIDKGKSIHRQKENNFILPLEDGRYLNIFEQVLEDNGVIIITTDISKDKKAEQEILFLRNYLANVIDSISSILIGVDENCCITQWNLAAEKETGLSFNDVYQKEINDAFPRLNSQLPNIKLAITEKKESSQLRRLFIRDGHTCHENITIYPLVTQSESGAVIRLDDVTEQVLISEMMIQTEKMLSIGGLAAGMAHEINNPLAGIMQTASVITNRLTDIDMPANRKAADNIGIELDKVNQYMDDRGVVRMLDNILESGKRMSSIVENMLDFSRQNEASCSEQDLISLLDKSLELSITDHNLKYNYEFKNITINKEYEKNIPPIKCEGGKIQQVILNILRNAAQAMQDAKVKSPTITFRVSFNKKTDTVSVEIEDNGPGIPENIQRRIFDPFFTTKKVGIGTGLGLSVSYFIITENHDGNLAVNSKLGQGTCFSICLPRLGKPVNTE